MLLDNHQKSDFIVIMSELGKKIVRVIAEAAVSIFAIYLLVMANDNHQPSVFGQFDKHEGDVVFNITGNSKISAMADTGLLLDLDITFKNKPTVSDLSDYVKCHLEKGNVEFHVFCEKREEESAYILEVSPSDKLDIYKPNRLVLEFCQPVSSSLIDDSPSDANLTTIGYLLVNIVPIDQSFKLETKKDSDATYKVPYNDDYFHPAFGIQSFVDYGKLRFWVDNDIPFEISEFNSFILSRALKQVDPCVGYKFDKDLKPISHTLHAGSYYDKTVFSQKITFIPNNDRWSIIFAKTKTNALELEYPVDETFIDVEVTNLSKDTEMSLRGIKSKNETVYQSSYETTNLCDWFSLPRTTIKPLETKTFKLWLDNTLEPGKYEYTVSASSLITNKLAVNVVEKKKNELILTRTDLGTFENRHEIVSITSDRIITRVERGYYDETRRYGFELFDKQGKSLAKCEYPKDINDRNRGVDYPFSANENYFVYRKDFNLKILSTRDFSVLGTVDLRKLVDAEKANDLYQMMYECKIVDNTFYCEVNTTPPKTFVLNLENMAAKLIDQDYNKLHRKKFENNYSIKGEKQEEAISVDSDVTRQPLELDCSEINPYLPYNDFNGDEVGNVFLSEDRVTKVKGKRIFMVIVRDPGDYTYSSGFVCVDVKTNKQMWAKRIESRHVYTVDERFMIAASVWGSQLVILDINTGKVLFKKRIAKNDEVDLRRISYLKFDNGSIYATLEFQRGRVGNSPYEYTKLVRFVLM